MSRSNDSLSSLMALLQAATNKYMDPAPNSYSQINQQAQSLELLNVTETAFDQRCCRPAILRCFSCEQRWRRVSQLARASNLLLVASFASFSFVASSVSLGDNLAPACDASIYTHSDESIELRIVFFAAQALIAFK